MSSFWPAFIALLCLAGVARLLYRLYFHPLSAIPGPIAARASRVWLLVNAARGKTHISHLKVHKDLGPVVRVAPNAILLANPQHGPQYYSWDKSDWWFCFRPPGEDAHLAFSTELQLKVHNVKKKRIASAYSLSSLLGHEEVFDKHVTAFVSRLGSFAKDGTSIDVGKWMSYLNSDLLMDAVFSAPLGCVEQGKDVRGLISANETFVKFAQFIGIFPVLFSLMSLPVMQAFAPKTTDETGAGVLFGTAERAVSERLESQAKSRTQATKAPSDMLQTMSYYRDTDTVSPIPPRELKNEALVAMLSGADTVSCTLRVAMLMLATRKDVCGKLRKEIEQAKSEGKFSMPVASYEQLRHLPYLVATVRELVRIHPPMATPFWRVAPEGGVTLDGYYIPAGTHVGINEWVVSRNAELYGDDVDVFRPERFLDNDADRKLKLDKLDLLFAYGDYSCLGKSFTLVETYKVISEVVRRFDVEVMDPKTPWKSSASISFVHEDFWCKFHPMAEARQ